MSARNGRDGLALRRLRIAAWSAVGLVLLLPLVAMRFTDEVNWTLGDFVFAAVLMGGTGGLFELTVRLTGNGAYRAGAALALAAAFLLIWANGAVGVIGSEDNPANVMYGAVFAVGFLGSILARFRPRGMSLVMFAAALVQALITAIAVIGDLGAPYNGPVQILAINGFFITLWVGSGLLFRQAARPEA